MFVHNSMQYWSVFISKSIIDYNLYIRSEQLNLEINKENK